MLKFQKVGIFFAIMKKERRIKIEKEKNHLYKYTYFYDRNTIYLISFEYPPS